MKRYTEFAKEELAALDDVGVQRLIDIEIAFEGIVPVPEPEGITLKKADLKKTVTAWKVDGLVFKNREDAEQVALMELMDEGYDYQGAGYEYKWAEPKIFGVETVQFYNMTDVKAAGSAIKEFNARKDQYERDKDAYDRYRDCTSRCRDAVWEAVSEARKEMCKIEAAIQTLQKYKDLADGDEAVAANFFRNTYKEQPDMIKVVLGEESDIAA